MKSPLAYVGGKSKLAKQIIEKIPPHKTYVECFTGGGWVFFTKEKSRFEVINDFDEALVNFYKVIQNHLDEFLRQFDFFVFSRQQFLDWKDETKWEGLTDIQRAVRYYYIQRSFFAGNVKHRSFGTGAAKYPRINFTKMKEELRQVHERFLRVTIENVDWSKCLQIYDKPETFFYLDPPYYKLPYYKHNLKHSDYEKMSDILKELKGRFILSLNDTPEVREIFKVFKIEEVFLTYTVSKNVPKNAKELLISNLV